jgi:hypothetical protein
VAVDHFDDGTSSLNEASFQTSVHGEGGRAVLLGQVHNVVVGMQPFFGCLNHGGSLVKQSQQQSSALEI